MTIDRQFLENITPLLSTISFEGEIKLNPIVASQRGTNGDVDLIDDVKIIDIKSSNSNPRSYDMFQLLTYIAQYYDNTGILQEEAGIINPVQLTYYRIDLSALNEGDVNDILDEIKL